jgi:hypothetical protein
VRNHQTREGGEKPESERYLRSSEGGEVAAVTEEKRKRTSGREKSVQKCYFNKYTTLQ